MMNKELQFLIYSTPEENVLVDVVVKDENIWVTQKAMAELFGVKVPAISKHLKNIFEEGELQQKSTISKMEIVDSSLRFQTILYSERNVLSSSYTLSRMSHAHLGNNFVPRASLRHWSLSG